jgi:hypothetical protein
MEDIKKGDLIEKSSNRELYEVTKEPCPVCNGTGWMEVEGSKEEITSVNDILNPKTDNNLPEDNVH